MGTYIYISVIIFKEKLMNLGGGNTGEELDKEGILRMI